ncbi:P-loop NTPase fold protein [Kutzneria sp. 744]|uniref:P-loop NTPase fold protein n=1 Tax=Kutzneria sp. (strain 744) TaxID=345341 RepID=UPI000A044871|nr:P-loop NTPase fold protein [Kutzneria sp. 744]
MTGPIPRQLPAPVQNFIGRDSEIELLNQLVGGETPGVIQVVGMGGVGKTALVVHWANQVAENFPYGQIFLDMRGYSAGGVPVAPAVALASVLSAFGVEPDRMPDGLDARSALFREMASFRHMLIVLDNVAASEQVAPLVPDDGDCQLVITSRRDLNLSATTFTRLIRVDPLADDESRELLAEVLGGERMAAEPEAVSRLIDSCQGLPLALRVAAGRALRSQRPLSELADSTRGLEDVVSTEHMLSLTYATLSSEAARLLRRLGLHPGGPVKIAEAAALADVPPQAAAALLETLANESMLDRDGADSYQLHSLIHAYAHELLLREETAEGRAAAETRLSRLTRVPRRNVEFVDDAPACKDRLDRDLLAEDLAKRLRQAQDRRPEVSFLLHLDGPWGAGKTSLLNLIEHELAASALVVTFNAWRYARVEPPWWALITCLRDQLIRAQPRRNRLWWHVKETWARVRRSGASYLLAMLVLAVLVAAVLMIFQPIPLAPKDFGDFAKAITGGLGVLAAFWSVGKIAARLLLWNSASGARLLEQSHTNPMREVTEHFAWLVDHASKPVVLFIDDLDRCDEKYVVAILEAVQNLVRDAPGGTKQIPRAASFVVAADGAWLRRAYEKTYENFQGAVDEPGRPLGHLFLDKLFQLSVPMPAMGEEARSCYFDTLLGVAPDSGRQEPTDEVHEAQARMVSSRTEGEVLDVLDNASPPVRRAVIADAIAKMSTPEVSAATEHELQKFAPLLLANPRGMKRFVNTYGVVRTLRTLEGNTVGSDALALWTIIRLRWPLLAEHLEQDADLIDRIMAAEADDDLPDQLKCLITAPEVRRFFKESQLTPAMFRSCGGGQIG